MMAEKTIHTKSFPNVETERIAARLEYFRWNLHLFTESSRNDFGARVREIINCERELAHRGIPFVPVTDGKHLSVSTDEHRHIRPPLGRKQRENLAR